MMKFIAIIALGLITISSSFGKSCNKRINQFTEAKLFGQVNSPRYDVNLRARDRRNTELTKKSKSKDSKNIENIKINNDSGITKISYTNNGTKNDNSSLKNSDYKVDIELNDSCKATSSKIVFLDKNKKEAFSTELNRSVCEEISKKYKKEKSLLTLTKEKRVLKQASLDVCKYFKFEKEEKLIVSKTDNSEAVAE